ncbi:unnamed protein product [Toxocara canis]|uniref:Zf-RVT domain-containing protein n=1 Tax=Toxocara canis TaxID=6265 RepID=A0A183UEU0_TOXCA|nr:unnamed protein product [Toxocara canis]
MTMKRYTSFTNLFPDRWSHSVFWLWRNIAPGFPLCDDSYLGLGRLKSLLKRVGVDRDVQRHCDDTIKEQLSRQIVEKREAKNGDTKYIQSSNPTNQQRNCGQCVTHSPRKIRKTAVSTNADCQGGHFCLICVISFEFAQGRLPSSLT